MAQFETVWTFRTKRFTVALEALEDYDTDLSWDETGEVREKLESGEYVSFCAKVSVSLDDREISVDYLGGCIYASTSEFIDHRGLAAKSRADGCNYGSYFSDMVRTAIKEARAALRDTPQLRK